MRKGFAGAIAVVFLVFVSQAAFAAGIFETAGNAGDTAFNFALYGVISIGCVCIAIMWIIRRYTQIDPDNIWIKQVMIVIGLFILKSLVMQFFDLGGEMWDVIIMWYIRVLTVWGAFSLVAWLFKLAKTTKQVSRDPISAVRAFSETIMEGGNQGTLWQRKFARKVNTKEEVVMKNAKARLQLAFRMFKLLKAASALGLKEELEEKVLAETKGSSKRGYALVADIIEEELQITEVISEIYQNIVKRYFDLEGTDEHKELDKISGTADKAAQAVDKK